MKKTRTLFYATLLLVLTNYSMFAGDGKGWIASADPQKVFIENKGQFKLGSESSSENSVVKYAYDAGTTMIYFSKSGISYSFLKRWHKNENEDPREMAEERTREQKELKEGKSHSEIEAEEHRMKFKTDVVNMIWEGANPNAQLIAEDITTDSHTYVIKKDGTEEGISNIKAYKKLIYKNLYPGIDVEYVFHPQDGLKYTLIIHPGADASLVKMKYPDGASVSANGDLHIQTKFGDIIDHAPLSFYSGNTASTVTSRFSKSGKIISLALGAYNHSLSLTIDPWTQTPALNNSNCVWECEKDGAGNVYIIGGDSPMKLLKYNSTGVLQWTYNTPYDTANYWLGTFAVDLAGNSYVTAGSVAAIQKVNTAGALVWNATSGVGSSNEYWNIAFNCDQTRLIVGGTASSGFNLRGAIFDINTASGSINTTRIVGYGSATAFPPSIQEVRSITASRNARYYFLTLDTLGCIDQNFSSCSGTAPIFKINSGYHLSYKCEDYRYDNTGIMAIKANGNFVYTQNGTNVQKRSLTTGAIITTVAIPGGISTSSFGQNVVGNSGLDIDSCGNIYVGSSNAVIKYDPNLVLLSSVATSFRVLDVAVSYGGNIIACGSTGNSSTSGRTGYVQQINMTTCNPMTLICCNTNVCAAGPFCPTTAPVTLTPEQAGGTWSGPGITNAGTGTFDPAVAGPGTHTINYTLACGTGSMTIIVNPCTVSPITACQTSGGQITASNGVGTYTWYHSTTTTPCVPGFGSCGGNFGFVAGTPTTTWSSFATGTTITPGTNYPIWVVDGNNDSLQITSLASLPNCTSCPTLTITPSSQVNVSCFGQSTGSFSVSTAGGASPYDYTLMNGATTVATFTNVAGAQSFSNLPAGTYTLNVLDDNGCPGTATITITQPASASSVSITSSTNASCGASNGSATATAAGGTSPYDYVWTGSAGTLQTTNNISGANTLSGLTAGTYTVTITDANNCTASATATISSTGGATVSITSQNDVLCFGGTTGDATATAAGGTSPYDYVWTGSAGALQTTNNVAGPNTLSGLGAGTYTVTVTDNGGCISSSTVSINEPASAASVAITGTTSPPCGASTGTATAQAGGGSSPYDYVWTGSAGILQTTNNIATSNTLSGLSAGTYTVTITDNNGCTSSATATVTSIGGASVSISSQTNILCFGSATGDATATASGGSSPYNYVWTNGTGTIQTSNNIAGANTVDSLAAGTYTVTVTDNSGCVSSTNVTITQPATANSVSITSSVNAACGSSNGSATAQASGGTSPYDYVWTSGAGTLQTTNNISGPDVLSSIAAGTYTVTITDNNGCVATTTAIISNAGAATTTITSSTNVSCFGTSTGSATANTTGGSSPYDYVWTGSAGTLQTVNNTTIANTLDSLAAGTYTVTVTDNGGCVSNATVTITQPVSALTLSTSASTPTTCGLNNGTASVSATGGSPAYSYNWSPAGGAGTSASSLSAGSYTITVSDANSCTATSTAVIGASTGVTASTTHTNVSCSGGSNGTATAIPSGGTSTYTYSWSSGGGSAATASGLPAGTYTVTVTSGSCSNTAVATITQPATIAATISTTPATCTSATGTATINVTSGTGPFTYSWTGGSTGTTANNLSAGSVSVTVSYGTGCTQSFNGTIGSTGSITASAGPDVTIISGESTTLTATGGTNYVWSPATGLSCTNCASPDASPGATTQYCVTATDVNGCSDSSCVIVDVDIKCGELFVPTAFSPNNDAENDILYVMGNCITNLNFAVFDRWGEKVFETSNPATGWDGTLKGKPLDAAVFVYYLTAKVDGKEVKKHGNITLVK